jgi:hypothetical protein
LKGTILNNFKVLCYGMLNDALINRAVESLEGPSHFFGPILLALIEKVSLGMSEIQVFFI